LTWATSTRLFCTVTPKSPIIPTIGAAELLSPEAEELVARHPDHAAVGEDQLADPVT
jgi:hypothetical protein